MSDRLKKILIIAGFVLVVFALGFTIYFVFFRPVLQPTVPVSVTPTVPGQLPTAGTGIVPPTGVPTGPTGLPGAAGVPTPVVTAPAIPPTPSRTTVLSATAMNNLALSPAGGVRSYNPTDGKFYRIADNGTLTPMSDQVFNQVQDVTWGNRTDKAILTYPDGSKTLYDFTLQKQVTLPKHWENFNFSPQDDKIVAKSIGNNPDNQFLVTANPDGSNAKLVEDMGNNADKVMTGWSPNNQVIAFAFTGEALGMDRQQVLLVGQNHENFKGLVVEGRGFVPAWSPSGNNLMYSVYNSNNNYMPDLWFSGASGDNVNANRTDLQLATWADKCVWQNEDTAFCAVPQSLPDGAGLQRQLVNGTPDDVYKIDLKTGQKTNLGSPDGAPTVDKIIVSPDGKSLYLHNSNDGTVLKFAL